MHALFCDFSIGIFPRLCCRVIEIVHLLLDGMLMANQYLISGSHASLYLGLSVCCSYHHLIWSSHQNEHKMGNYFNVFSL